MKNLIICLLLSCFFMQGNSALAACEFGGAAEVIIVAPKTGQTVCSFELPKGYKFKGSAVEIVVRQGKGVVVYSEASKDLNFALPSTISGTVHVTLKIGSFIFTQKISL